jgi:hypothetical protein
MIIDRTITEELCPAGVCPAKLARRIKQSLGLTKKPKITYGGTVWQGSDNLRAGAMTIDTGAVELSAEQVAQIDALIISVSPCKDSASKTKADAGVDLDDLDDLLPTAFPGHTYFVRDLARADGSGNGCMVYRDADSWRRISDDFKVYP